MEAIVFVALLYVAWKLINPREEDERNTTDTRSAWTPPPAAGTPPPAARRPRRRRRVVLDSHTPAPRETYDNEIDDDDDPCVDCTEGDCDGCPNNEL